MTSYFIRRFLLIIPTFLGITIAVFVVMHFVPGGPVERQIMRYRMAAAEGGGGGRVQVELPAEAIEEMRRYYGFDKPVYTRYALWLWNLAHLDLGRSYVYQDPVWDVIKSRFPVSIFLGLTGFFLSYFVCVPLGVYKAIRHLTKFDLVSSVIVFLGYSIPGWALGTALLVLFGGGSFWSLFPLGGFRPDNWNYLGFFAKITAQLHYMFLPVLCYMIGSFATLTILMKNSVMENLGCDYIRAAICRWPDGTPPPACGTPDSHRHRPRQRHRTDPGRLVPHRKSVQYRRHGLPGLHLNLTKRLSGRAGHPGH